MNIKVIFLALALSFAAATLAGCGSSTKVAESKSADTVKKVEQVSDNDLDSYFDSYASGDPDKMAAAQSLASPGSLAEAYLIHQGALANSYLDGGSGSTEDKSTKTAEGYRLCDPNSNEKDSCTAYTDFKSVDGKLSSFTVNGLDLTNRLAIGKGAAVKAGSLATVKFISSYQAASNYLFAVLEVKSADKKLILGTYQATYRAPGGRQSTATGADGPAELGANSTANISIVFEKAKPGGELTLTIAVEDYNLDKSVTLKIG